MKRRWAGWAAAAIALSGCDAIDSHEKGERFVAASDLALHYSGRWDRANPSRPRASWPGFAVSTDFEGRKIAVRMKDAGNFYNVEVDGKFQQVIGGKRGTHLTYTLAENLTAGVHRVRLQRRNISFEEPTEIQGFLVDDGAKLGLPEESRRKHIEFIGDSYTAAEGNEAVTASLPWQEKYPVTNFDKGFAARLAVAMDAEITTVCRSGSGLMCDWKGGKKHPIAERYGWTLMESASPPWSFTEADPDWVVISLGLNDYNGLKKPDGSVSAAASEEFRTAYRRLISEIRRRHPSSKIVAIGPFVPWAREQISTAVAAEKAAGHDDVFYAQFDKFPSDYVADGHPTVATHQKMADQILAQFERLGLISGKGKARK